MGKNKSTLTAREAMKYHFCAYDTDWEGQLGRTEAGHWDERPVYGYRGTELKMNLAKKPSGYVKKTNREIDKGGEKWLLWSTLWEWDTQLNIFYRSYLKCTSKPFPPTLVDVPAVSSSARCSAGLGWAAKSDHCAGNLQNWCWKWNNMMKNQWRNFTSQKPRYMKVPGLKKKKKKLPKLILKHENKPCLKRMVCLSHIEWLISGWYTNPLFTCLLFRFL